MYYRKDNNKVTALRVAY